MKIIRSAVLGLALSLGTAAAVQAQAAAPAQRGEHAMRGPGGRMGAGRGDRGALKGITLSDAQKAQLKTVHAKYKAQHDAERARMEPVMAEVKAARQKGDTAAARAAWAKAGDARTQGEAVRKQEMADLRNVLTADQQKQFDANVATMQANRGKEMKHRGGRKAGRVGAA
jgi:Spy/CpxP family protein refolding chaperone